MARGRGKLTPQDEEYKKIISARLNKLLSEHDIKQSHLADILEIPRSSFNEYVKGNTLPNPGNVQKIADYFGLMKSDIDPRFLPRNKTNITPFPSSSQPEITQIYNSLSPDSKSKLLKYAKLLQEADNIEYYEVTATTKLSAGLGYAFNEYDQERVYVANRPPRHDLASFVYGDSMEPKFQSEELVYLVDKGLSSYDGEICAVAYDGETFIKRVYTEAGKLRLVSLNPKYDDIVIDFPPGDGAFIRIYEVVGSDTTVQI